MLQCRWTLCRWIAPISRYVGHGPCRTHGHKSCNQRQLRKARREGPRAEPEGWTSQKTAPWSTGNEYMLTGMTRYTSLFQLKKRGQFGEGDRVAGSGS